MKEEDTGGEGGGEKGREMVMTQVKFASFFQWMRNTIKEEDTGEEVEKDEEDEGQGRQIVLDEI